MNGTETQTTSRDELIAYRSEEIAYEHWSETTHQATYSAPDPCPHCGGYSGQWRGTRNTIKHGVVHRRYCNTCRRWHQQRGYARAHHGRGAHNASTRQNKPATGGGKRK